MGVRIKEERREDGERDIIRRGRGGVRGVGGIYKKCHCLAHAEIHHTPSTKQSIVLSIRALSYLVTNGHSCSYGFTYGSVSSTRHLLLYSTNI